MIRYVNAGGLRTDYLITHDGRVHNALPGGNALYAAVGAAIWSHEIGIWARVGSNFPRDWLDEVARQGIGTVGLVTTGAPQDHRTFFAYMASGERLDTEPAKHYARVGATLPPDLTDYIHSTPRQDDPDVYEPLALRPEDWPSLYETAVAVHLSPMALVSHRHLPQALRQQGVRQVTVDPGERYMVPEREAFIRPLLAQIDAFLPSDMEVRSLFGAGVDLGDAARRLCAWGASLVVVKAGKRGVLLVGSAQPHLVVELAPYHRPGDPRVVDATGAGDAFGGGFMVGLAETGDPAQAARMGMVSASFVIEGYGALYALGRPRAEAEARLQELENRG